MRERRAEVREAVRRRRRRRTASVVLLLALGLAALAVGRSPLFTIDEVRVEGVEEARAAEVRDAMGVAVGQNLFDADLAAARGRVLALPWVREADVDQAPPSSVVAQVVPRTSAAVLLVGDGAWVLDGRGVVIDGGERPGAPTLRADGAEVPPLGGRVTDPGVRAALRVASALPGGFADRVDSYAVDDLGRVVAVLDTEGLLPAQDELAVVIGSSERIADKVTVSTAMLDVIASDQRAAEEPAPVVLDVSAPDNPVLRAQ